MSKFEEEGKEGFERGVERPFEGFERGAPPKVPSEGTYGLARPFLDTIVQSMNVEPLVTPILDILYKQLYEQLRQYTEARYLTMENQKSSLASEQGAEKESSFPQGVEKDLEEGEEGEQEKSGKRARIDYESNNDDHDDNTQDAPCLMDIENIDNQVYIDKQVQPDEMNPLDLRPLCEVITTSPDKVVSPAAPVAAVVSTHCDEESRDLAFPTHDSTTSIGGEGCCVEKGGSAEEKVADEEDSLMSNTFGRPCTKEDIALFYKDYHSYTHEQRDWIIEALDKFHDHYRVSTAAKFVFGGGGQNKQARDLFFYFLNAVPHNLDYPRKGACRPL
jgi:hypothetical protein